MKYGLNEKNLNQLNSVFKEFSEIDEIILYGSRAKGNFRKGSDIDIVLKGKKINHNILNKLSLKLDDLYLPYILDLDIYHKINNNDLINHISKVGIRIYKKALSILFFLICSTNFISCSSDTSSPEYWFYLLLWICILGFITGLIASSKGHSFMNWFIFGAALFIIAFPMALFLKKTEDNINTKKCLQCAEIIKNEAKKCRYCGFDFLEKENGDVVNEKRLEQNFNENNIEAMCRNCNAELELSESEIHERKFICPICRHLNNIERITVK